MNFSHAPTPETVTESDLHGLLRDPRFKSISTRIRRFNIFEALRITSYEIRHSDFLAFLLDPDQTHGLRDLALKPFAQFLAEQTGNQALSLKLELADLSRTSVYREWRGVDILAVNRDIQLVILLENKIFSKEHDDQLARYIADVRAHFPDFIILAVLLSPDGVRPSHDDFLPLDYSAVQKLLDELKGAITNTSHSVSAAIDHYTEMIETHLTPNSELRNLCEQIYAQHEAALNLLFEYRPDKEAAIADYLKKLIPESGLILDASNKRYIRFCPPEWDDGSLKVSTWTNSKRVLLFEFENFGKLTLRLYIGPAPDNENLRSALTERAQNSRALKPNAGKSTKWRRLYSKEFVAADVYSDSDVAELEKLIEKEWKHFTSTQLETITSDLIPVSVNGSALTEPTAEVA